MPFPSTRHIDLTLKRAKFEEVGVLAYWVVDPDEPSITALELRDGRYELVAEARGQESFTTEVPFPLTLVPSELHD